jgi:signal transduction histidine kinase/CheY-like chemotaxis protein
MSLSVKPRNFFHLLKRSSEFPWLLMCAIALVVVIYLSLSDWQQVHVANQQSRRSDQSLQSIAALRSAISDAEGSQRGYLLTGRDEYLGPYLKAKTTLPVLLANVHTYALDTIPQRVRIDRLDHLVHQKLSEMTHTIDLRKAGQPGQSMAVVLTDRGKNLMDETRSVIQSIEYAELEDHRETSARVEHLAAIAGAASSLAVLSGLLLLTVAVWRIQREKSAVLEANEAKSRFLANMSHELRTPLNAIIGYSEMLGEEAEDSGQLSFLPDLNRIRTAGRHLLDLINSVLDISKIEAGKMDLYLETFSIRRLVSDVQDVVKPLFDKNENQFVIHCPDDIGNMHSDQTKLRQCLYNLLSNAAKFTSKGEIRLTVRRPSENGDYLHFSIQDSGIGMSAEQIQHVFEPFTQADSATTRRFGGTGLGLAITRRFSEMLGGSVQAQSTPGVGSTFTLLVPASIGPRTESLATPALTPVSGSETLVLAIDDDPSVHDLLRRSLIRYGFRVESAYSGDDGIRMARRLRPDAITLDVLMQGIDGWSVLRSIKADHEISHIPVIMLTVMDNRNHGFLLGATDYLSKPIDRGKLIGVLGRYRPRGVPGTALVIEDDFDARRIISTALKAEGWKVDEAENGRVGLECLSRSKPSLILLDLMMPEMDGFEFVTRLKDFPDYKDIPIVVLTAHELSEEDRTRLNGQVQKVLRKQSVQIDGLMGELLRIIAARAPQLEDSDRV